MTFQDSKTYNYYVESILPTNRVVLDASEFPDKVAEVKFWQAYCVGGGRATEFYAIGEVVIGNDFE